MQFITDAGPRNVQITSLTIAGWTGRNAAAVTHHIEELAAIGVAPPSTVPLFYRVASAMLTQSDRIEVLGNSASGEAEPMIVNMDGTLWLGLGSDHTDRALETHSVAASKQICAKPCSEYLWNLKDLQDDLDAIQIKSWIRENGDWVLYQDGTLSQIRPLMGLVEGANLPANGAMMCGTFAAIGGVRASDGFKAVMRDPKRDREITLEYAATVLPIIS